MSRAIVLDRDGTLIDFHRDEELGAVVSAFHPRQLRVLPGVAPGLRRLADAGFRLAIATNQPGPAKGEVSRAALEATNAALVELLGRDGVRVEVVEACFHHPDGGPGGDASLARPCACRKPAPGMLVRALERLGADAAESVMIGDGAVDVAAGKAAGMRTGLVVPRARCETCPLRSVTADFTAATIDELATLILADGRVAQNFT